MPNPRLMTSANGAAFGFAPSCVPASDFWSVSCSQPCSQNANISVEMAPTWPQNGQNSPHFESKSADLHRAEGTLEDLARLPAQTTPATATRAVSSARQRSDRSWRFRDFNCSSGKCSRKEHLWLWALVLSHGFHILCGTSIEDKCRNTASIHSPDNRDSTASHSKTAPEQNAFLCGSKSPANSIHSKPQQGTARQRTAKLNASKNGMVERSREDRGIV